MNQPADKRTAPVNKDAIDRVDGRQKVTGTAKYSAEYEVPGVTYGVLISSTIAKGTIKNIDSKAAEKAPGVFTVLSHLNMPAIPGYANAQGDIGPNGIKIFPGNKVYFGGQPIALVVADTYERALHAASLVQVSYTPEQAQTDMSANRNLAKAPRNARQADYKRGEAAAWKTAPVQLEEEYTIAHEVHNPMELGSITAVWDNDKLTVYDKTQGVKAVQQTFARLFNIPNDNVRVIAPFVGGGFGMALRTWPYEVAAVVAARQISKPVKLVLQRSQMFTMVGYRPYTEQKVGIGATADGKLVGISHSATGVTAGYEEFTEGVINMTKFMYACPNVDTTYRIVPMDLSVPTWMRGPGEATGSFALESAIDELAYKLDIDPLELRIRNHADMDPERNLPWSSKYLKECYQLGAERIGWFQRNRAPRSMREDNMLVGYGMSSGTFGAFRGNASAKAVFSANGRLLVQSAASDIGPGTGTAMVSVAAETLGLAPSLIKFELGDSSLPPAPTQGGSGTTSAVGSAVYDVCMVIKEKLAELATTGDNAPFKGADKDKLTFSKGNISDGSKSVSFTSLLQQNSLPSIEAARDSKGGNERQKYSMYSFSVHFTKVHVHPTTGVVRVKKVVTVADAGKIVSEKTAQSQMIGGVIGGIGMALTEEGVIDHRYGRYANNNLADYHVPVHADIPPIEALFINKPDPYINPIGAKGMGEIALIGFAASVANAVYHATGKRVRELPITLDKLL
ncbi:MAG: xanthine dehydrogenase family protein molybdopterin-binding subunit [Chitinophagaceae bacterium]